MRAGKSWVEVLKKNLFYIVARGALWGYRRAPVFGVLRASLGVIRREGRVLVIRRNDGRGLCFPGGLAWPWESDEDAMLREVREETGLVATSFEFAFRYESRTDIAVRIAVFHVQAPGAVRKSWEGTPEWMEIAEVQPDILRSQKYIVERLLSDRDAGAKD
jgi:8-oxo-dGTP pyrophosphatase MutT (NUDIX family)